MSFSGEVKTELAKQISDARHCQLAELAALVYCCGKISLEESKEVSIQIRSENKDVVRKSFTLLKKAFNIDFGIFININDENHKSGFNYLEIRDAQVAEQIILALKLAQAEGGKRIPSVLLRSTCCKRAFLRGAYLSMGSMSDPLKGYHLEFVCDEMGQAEQLKQILFTFEIEAKIVPRKKYYILYLKEGSGIVELLNIMEAHIALMDLENMRIVKEMRNSINRRVNCEAANITKTVHAAAKQVDEITYIKEHYGFENLPDNLRHMAELRLECPEASLKELGELSQPKVGKSGVNHRLRKLSELADRIML